MNHLRIRITDDLTAKNKHRIEVVDYDGNVLGDLAHSVSDVTWKMGVQGGIGIVCIEVATERVSVESIELPGMNIAPLEAA